MDTLQAFAPAGVLVVIAAILTLIILMISRVFGPHAAVSCSRKASTRRRRSAVCSATAEPAGSRLHAEIDDRILATWEATGRNIAETSRRLGIARNTVYKRVKALRHR